MASTVLRDATKIFPAGVQCHLQLGRALARDGKLQDARVEYEIAVRQRPADPALHYELGLLYQRSGDKTAAESALARSKELCGSHASGPALP